MLESLELLRKLVSFNSIFPNEKNISEFLEEYLKSIGFQVSRLVFSDNPLRFNILAEKGHSDKSVLLYGHVDTVPVYGNWSNDPFTLVEKDGKLIGLGAFDMKSGCASFLKAVEKFNPKNFKIKIIFGADEENISEGGWALVGNDFMRDVKCVFVSEPGFSKRDNQGPSTLTLGRRGRCDIIIKVHGVSAHGAYNVGVNAINESAKIILELEKLKVASHSLLGDANLFARKINANSGSLSTPDYCEILIDRHLVPPETKEYAVDQIRELVQGMREKSKLDSKTKVIVELGKRKTNFLQPYITDSNHKLVKFVADIVKEKFKGVNYNYGLSVADDNIFGYELKLPVITIGPAGGNAHSADEFLYKQSYLDLIETYKLILERLDREFKF